MQWQILSDHVNLVRTGLKSGLTRPARAPILRGYLKRKTQERMRTMRTREIAALGKRASVISMGSTYFGSAMPDEEVFEVLDAFCVTAGELRTPTRTEEAGFDSDAALSTALDSAG